MQTLASFLCGLVFGSGLLVSGMTQPQKVLGFLDVLGRWDPTLAFVMASALVVSGVGYAVARRYAGPVLAVQYLWPTRTDIDRRLVFGSVLFGIGWGMVGLCPGPALENLASLSPGVFVFVLAMISGMVVQDWFQSRVHSATATKDTALAELDG